MALGYLSAMLKSAQAGKYAIAAFNIIDYNSARAVIDGAQEMNAPIIIQLSVKTIRLWGFKPIASWVHAFAADADVPVALHLDHCKDLDVIRGCIDAGWTSVMFDGSALPFDENVARSLEAYEIAQAAGVGLEAELGAIGGTEDDKFVAEDEAILADVDECIAFCAAMPKLATFAPAFGTAHGFYKGEPKIAYDRLERITAKVDIPIALHGGTGLTEQQFERCIQSGCAKVNISTMHKQQFIDGFADLRRKEPTNNEPIPYIAAQYDAMKSGVKQMIGLFGSDGKASVTAAR
ncbi:class II fructose-bisphosphate aldolase [Rhodospirillaceae bacterium KN72]|uniref:Class II fructose-bisphosphate aldolase n=1 Tax=Pacificispira spongiicola TaxID=2729598 RepID=A0A7Y0HFC6_9PROT|nr:class II fructose-bisphosphate aldolase [Pacificispira spongiicola]NMM45695.1 class II fructose-bisphosphate aldolase [Pacificispira spongiicola]